jgi:hypothetical protein
MVTATGSLNKGKKSSPKSGVLMGEHVLDTYAGKQLF